MTHPAEADVAGAQFVIYVIAPPGGMPEFKYIRI